MPGQGRRCIYKCGEWEVDATRRELLYNGSPALIGGRAFEILEVLAQSAGELVTKNDLISRIWPGAVVEENTLQVHISAIRKALAQTATCSETVLVAAIAFSGTGRFKITYPAVVIVATFNLRPNGHSSVIYLLRKI